MPNIMSHAEFVKKYGREPEATPLSNLQPHEKKSFYDQITNLVGARGIADEFGATLARATAPKDQKNLVEFPSLKKVVGSAVQSGANLVPGAGELGVGAKIGAGAVAGYGMDVGSHLQNGQANPLTPGVGTVLGGGLPVAGAVIRPAAAVLSRLLKGLGSGLSGASAKNLEAILANPKAAQKASLLIQKSGGSKLLENNARTIVNGVSQVRQGARAEFGKAMQGLAETDVNPQTFRQALQPVLDNLGVVSTNGRRSFGNTEFTDPKNLSKASALVDELSKTRLDGKSLHSLMSKIEDSKYKTATSDERLSFNAFLKDLHAGVKDAITASTDKLNEANAKYSHDMGLSESVEGIFGKVKYKNFPEVVNASKKLEGLFSQKGLSPEVTNEFLSKLGIDPSDFKAGEAIRQIGDKESSANSAGLSFGEMARSVTSAAITPEMVGKMAISSGLSREQLIPFLKALKTPARNLVIQALLSGQQDTQQ